MKIITQQLPVDQLGFGAFFCPWMLVAKYQNSAWQNWEISPAESFSIDPAAKVLHYGQEIFEGMKAYRQPSGKIQLFRPQDYIARMQNSAKILAMPGYPEKPFLEGLQTLVKKCADLIPEEPGSLYLRPTMIGLTPTLGVAAATEYLFYILASPVGGYFGKFLKDVPHSITVKISEQYIRAAKGGLGSAKTGGNYAASLRALLEIKKEGFDNVLFLDAQKREFLEELSGMNIFVVKDQTIITPPLGDTILPGVTRKTLLQLAPELGLKAQESPLNVNEVISGLKSGNITEVFACGTASAVTAIRELNYKNDTFTVGNGTPGPVSQKLFSKLTGLHYGRVEPKDASWILNT